MKTEYPLLESSEYTLRRFFRENNGQTSVEVILLIGAYDPLAAGLNQMI